MPPMQAELRASLIQRYLETEEGRDALLRSMIGPLNLRIECLRIGLRTGFDTSGHFDWEHHALSLDRPDPISAEETFKRICAVASPQEHGSEPFLAVGRLLLELGELQARLRDRFNPVSGVAGEHVP